MASSEVDDQEVAPAVVDPRRDRGRWTLIVVSYAVAAWILYSEFSLLPTTQIPLAPVSDQVQQVWFLAWPAHALSHLQNPFVTNYMNFPHGVNLMANTSMLLLGTLATPVTWLFGPIAAYVTLLRLGFFLSALSAAVCARRLGAPWWSSWLVGAIFGFSAQRMVDGAVHVFLAFDVILPWVAYGVIRFWQGRWSVRRFGLVVAGLLSAEFLISSERAAIEVALVVLVCVADLIVHRSAERARFVGRGLALAGVVTLVVISVPLWYWYFGPQAVRGAPHAYEAWEAGTLHSTFLPGGFQWFAPLGRSHSLLAAIQGPWYDTNYIGVALIVAAALGLWRRRRDGLVVGVAVVTSAFWVLTLGRSVRIPWANIAVVAPYRLVRAIPIIGSVLPSRYMEVVFLGLAFLAGCSLWPMAGERATSRVKVTSVAAVVVVLVVIGLVPNQRVAAASTSALAWLGSSASARALPQGSAVLTYPYATTLFNTPMLDQAQSGLWYRLIGGQAIVPGPGGRNVGVLPLAPTIVFDALYRSSLSDTGANTHLKFPVGPLPPLSPSTFGAFRTFATIHHVNEVFWRQWGYHPQLAKSYLVGAFGQPRSYDNGQVLIWRLTPAS